MEILISSRRRFLSNLILGSAALQTSGAFAEALLQTPAQTEGPFYPDKLPLDTDNDLIILNDNLTPAVGEITWLHGRILGPDGQPLRNATVEIWQCDSAGAYIHSRTSNNEKRDKNFQGFGRFLTGSSGEYQFRTIKPVAYPGRTPHIHMSVNFKGKDKFTTQCYIKGDARNERDGVFNSVRDAKLRDLMAASFEPLAGSKAGELTAKFDVVLGVTPAA